MKASRRRARGSGAASSCAGAAGAGAHRTIAKPAALASDPKILASKLDELARSEFLGELPSFTQFDKWDKTIEWLTKRWRVEMNGILADQIGFGVVVPTVLFLQNLRRKGLHGPYLIITSDNALRDWLGLLRTMDHLLYLGDKKERAKMRKEFMHKTVGPDFPIIVTTYRMAMSDKQWIPHYKWRYVVVDQGPDLKKWEFGLLDKLKGMSMGHRLLLIRPSFQNNLEELWSRLNFVLPDEFSSREEFDSWFVFSAKEDVLPSEGRWANLSNLHALLHLFLPREMEQNIETWVTQLRACRRIVLQDSNAISVTGSKDHAAIEGARTGAGSCQEVQTEVAFKDGAEGIPKNLQSSQYGLEGNKVKRPRRNDAPASPLEECNSSFQAPSRPVVPVQVPKSTSSELIFKSLKAIPELARCDFLRAYGALIRDDRQFESLMALPMDMRKDWLLMELGNSDPSEAPADVMDSKAQNSGGEEAEADPARPVRKRRLPTRLAGREWVR